MANNAITAAQARAAGLLPADEDGTQRLVVACLRELGYTVRVTSRRAKRCPRCKTYSHRGDGADRGIADLLVRGPKWPKGLWAAVEVKRPVGWKWSGREQRAAFEAGDFHLVRSEQDVLNLIATSGFNP